MVTGIQCFYKPFFLTLFLYSNISNFISLFQYVYCFECAKGLSLAKGTYELKILEIKPNNNILQRRCLQGRF